MVVVVIVVVVVEGGARRGGGGGGGGEEGTEEAVLLVVVLVLAVVKAKGLIDGLGLLSSEAPIPFFSSGGSGGGDGVVVESIPVLGKSYPIWVMVRHKQRKGKTQGEMSA